MEVEAAAVICALLYLLRTADVAPREEYTAVTTSAEGMHLVSAGASIDGATGHLPRYLDYSARFPVSIYYSYHLCSTRAIDGERSLPGVAVAGSCERCYYAHCSLGCCGLS